MTAVLCLVLTLMLAGQPVDALAAMGDELAAAGVASVSAQSDEATFDGDDETSQVVDESPVERPSASGGASIGSDGVQSETKDDGQTAVLEEAGSPSSVLSSARDMQSDGVAAADVPSALKVTVGSEATPNVSKTVVVAVPADDRRIAESVPHLWMWLYDTGDMVFSDESVPDPRYGNALGVWDASNTGSTWEERPAWIVDRPGVIVRRVVVAEGARLAKGAPTAAEALAAGDVPTVPAPRSIAWWFWNMSSLETCEGLAALDTSLVTSAESAFEGCASLLALDMGAWEGTSLGASGRRAEGGVPYGGGSAGAGVGERSAPYPQDGRDDARGMRTSDADSDTNINAEGPVPRASATETSPSSTALTCPATRMLAGCTSLGSITLSGSFSIRGASLPASTWRGADGTHVASTLLCSAHPVEVAGTWERADSPALVGGHAHSATNDSQSDAERLEGDFDGDVVDGLATSETSRPALAVAATLIDTTHGLELLLSTTPPGAGVASGVEVLGSWDVTDTGMGRVPWADSAPEITVVRIRESIAPVSMAGWFAGCSRLTTLQGADLVDASACRSMSSAFSGCSSLASLDLASWDVSSCRDFGSAFSGCSSLSSLDLDAWDVSSALTMTGMFAGCASLRHLSLGEAFSFASGCTPPAGTWAKCDVRPTDGDDNATLALGTKEDKGADADGPARGPDSSAAAEGGTDDARRAKAIAMADNVLRQAAYSLMVSADGLAELSGEELAGRWVRMDDDASDAVTSEGDDAGLPSGRSGSIDGVGGNVSVTVPLDVVVSVSHDGNAIGRIRIANESDEDVRLTGIRFLPSTSAEVGGGIGWHVRMGNDSMSDVEVLNATYDLHSLGSLSLKEGSIPSGDEALLSITGDLSDLALDEPSSIGTITWEFESYNVA